MTTKQEEYVVVPWGIEGCDTDVVTVELPSRDVVAQLEVPTAVVDSMARLGARREIPVEEALAERLEINRARVSLLAAKSAGDVESVREHLSDARRFLSGVETLETDGISDEIERVWRGELGRE